METQYSLGAIKNDKDLRRVQLAQVQAPVAIPTNYTTDISMIPVLNQKQLGACVGHAHALAQIYYELKENGKIKMLSPRYLYALSKQLNGMPLQQGTQPRVTASVMFKNGCATETAIPNNTDLSHDQYISIPNNEEIIADAKPYKIRGYAEVASDKEALKQAIFQNGVVAITISVGNFNNPILRGNLGLHRVLLYGYSDSRFFYRNSWGIQWGESGNGYFDWGTQDVIDALAFVDLPNAIIEEAKKKYKYFTEKEVNGLKEELVRKLDEARGYAGIPFRITSGFRTIQQNSSVGGVDGSEHTLGLGCDILADTSEKRFKIVSGALKAGFTRIGCYLNHIHLGVGQLPSFPQNVIWVINKD